MLEKVGVVKDQTHDALDDAQDVRTLVRRMAAQNDEFTFQSFVRDERQVILIKVMKLHLVESFIINSFPQVFSCHLHSHKQMRRTV